MLFSNIFLLCSLLARASDYGLSDTDYALEGIDPDDGIQLLQLNVRQHSAAGDITPANASMTAPCLEHDWFPLPHRELVLFEQELAGRLMVEHREQNIVFWLLVACAVIAMLVLGWQGHLWFTNDSPKAEVATPSKIPQIVISAVCLMVMMAGGMFPSTFFQKQATKWGVSNMTIGLLNGSGCVTSIISGWYSNIVLDRFGKKPVVVTFLPMCGILCALTVIVNVPFWFFLRMVGGLLGGIMGPAMFGLVYGQFGSEDLAFAAATCETACNLAYLAMPFIGGVLYDNFGFDFPFLAYGVINCILAVLIWAFVNDPNEQTDTEEAPEDGTPNDDIDVAAQVFQPKVVMLMFGSFMIALSECACDPFYNAHFRGTLGNDFSASSTGAMVMIIAVTCLLFGWVTPMLMKHGFRGTRLILFGAGLYATSYIITGLTDPTATNLGLPVIALPKHSIVALGLQVVLVALIGTSYGFAQVPIMPSAMQVTGASENPAVMHKLTAMFTVTGSLGAMCGTVGAGALMNTWGFASLVIILACCYLVYGAALFGVEIFTPADMPSDEQPSPEKPGDMK